MTKDNGHKHIEATKSYISLLLIDWKSNIKEFDIVHDDILQRIDKNLPLYIERLSKTK